MEDEVIRILFDFAREHPSQNPSEAERMAIIARRLRPRLQAPGSTSICCSALQANGLGRSIAEAILCCLWDGTEGRAYPRSVDECIRQAKADMTIRTPFLNRVFFSATATSSMSW